MVSESLIYGITHLSQCPEDGCSLNLTMHICLKAQFSKGKILSDFFIQLCKIIYKKNLCESSISVNQSASQQRS